MKSNLPLSAILILALTGVASADLPKKAPLSRYSGLWKNSPFTAKPPPTTAGPENNPLDDYALIGVSPIGGTNYRVTLINKKKPDDRITVDSDKPSKDGFKVLEVIRKAGDPLGTTVRMTSGSMTGVVSFDEKLLTLAAPPKAAAPQPNQPQIPGLPVAGQTGTPQRQPRPRVVPPPAPTAAQAQPAQPVQNQRPSRRGN